MRSVVNSLKRINGRLYLALLVMGVCPAVYTTMQTFFLGQLPGDGTYSIAGQLAWVSLLYDVANEAMILPLFYFFGGETKHRETFVGRLKSGLLAVFGVYFVLSALVIVFVKPLLRMMAASPDILDASAVYIRIESVANLFGILYSFACVALVTLEKDVCVYLLTGAKLLLCIVSDAFLVSKLPFSLQLGVNGVALSDVVVNACLLAIALVLLARLGFSVFGRIRPSFGWMKDLARVGGISGAESFVRNAAYLLMVTRLMNMVGEEGTYWVANNFVWGWLLLPILQLGELIKQETAGDERAIRENTPGYFAITGAVCVLWVLLIPSYKPFMRSVLNFEDVDKLFRLVLLLLASCVLYAFQNVFDMTFYGRGKTHYMLFETVVTSIIYYGTFFFLWRSGAWTPTLMGIALMFGGGNAFDSVVSAVAYRFFLRTVPPIQAPSAAQE